MAEHSSKTKVSNVWRLTDNHATLCCGKLIGKLDVSNPTLGIGEVEFDGHPLTGSLWGFEIPNNHPIKLQETYLRGHDLVAHYLASDGYPFDLYCYWNIQPVADGCGVMIRLTISWQTDLLDSDPELVLKTTWPGELEISTSERTQVTRTLSNATACELPHPSDLANCNINEEGHLKVDLPFLEKGVIRRARFAMVLVPNDANVAITKEAVEQFCSEPLPLTT